MASPNIMRIFFASFIAFLLLTIVVASGVYLLGGTQEQPMACTLELKLCPDGSTVGRTGPNCEFTQCLEGAQDENIDTSTWKTYRNEKYAYEIKYPSTWKISYAISDLFLQAYNDHAQSPYEGDDFVILLPEDKEETYIQFINNYEGIGVGTTWVGADGDLVLIKPGLTILDLVKDSDPWKEDNEDYGWGRENISELTINSIRAKKTRELWDWEGTKDEEVVYLEYKGSALEAKERVNSIAIIINYNRGNYQKNIFEEIVKSFTF